MPPRSPADLRTCAALRAEGIRLRPSLAEVRVAAQCGRTGRLRRVLTTEAVVSFTPDELAPALPFSLEEAARRPWSFDPAQGLLVPWVMPGWPQVRLTPHRQRRGVRWLYACPACHRPTRHICAVPTGEGDVTGCRRCLGLVYPSQSHHRTRQGDEDVVQGRRPATAAALRQAQARDQRRFSKAYGRFARVLGHPLAFFENTEAVHAAYGRSEVWLVPHIGVEPLAG